jgi:hypothetical protein
MSDLNVDGHQKLDLEARTRLEILYRLISDLVTDPVQSAGSLIRKTSI